MEHTSSEKGGEAEPDKPVKPEARREQWFRFGPWAFDITKGRDIAARYPRLVRPLPVEPWARFYGLDRWDGGSFPIFGPRRIDTAYALTTDLTEPVLVGTMRNLDGVQFPLLIDGTHRLYRAFAESVDELPAYVLTAEETLAIRSDGVVGPDSGVKRRG